MSAVSSPQKLATFFAHHSRSLGDRPFFRHAKICRSFCGAPVRPNMLNMPKSAAVLKDFSTVQMVVKSSWNVPELCTVTSDHSSNTYLIEAVAFSNFFQCNVYQFVTFSMQCTTLLTHLLTSLLFYSSFLVFIWHLVSQFFAHQMHSGTPCLLWLSLKCIPAPLIFLPIRPSNVFRHSLFSSSTTNCNLSQCMLQ